MVTAYRKQSTGKQYSKLFETKTGRSYRRVIDDTVMLAYDLKSSFGQMWAYLTFSAENGITLNIKKIQFAQNEIKAFGYNIGQSGICPMQEFTASIKNFPKLTNLKGSRAFFVLVNQAAYMLTPEDRKRLAKLRGSLSPKSNWKWLKELNEMFDKIPAAVADGIKKGINRIEPGKPMIMRTDWSKSGWQWLCTVKSHCGHSPE